MTAEATVASLISDAQTYAASSFADAQSFISDAVSAASGFSTPIVPTFNFSTNDIQKPNYVSAPNIFNDSFQDQGAVPTVPTFQAVSVPTAPTFANAPDPIDLSTLFQTPVPIYDIGPFSQSAPTINTSLAIPAAPQIQFPDAPTQTSITIRNAPTPIIPQFTAIFQGQDPGAAPNTEQKLIDTYSNALPQFKAYIDAGVDEWMTCYAPDLKALSKTLSTQISEALSSGSPLDNAFEENLFTRARSRAETERNRQQLEVTRNYAKRGYAIPNGQLALALSQVTQISSDQIAKSAQEIAIERARLEYQFKQFILNLANSSQQSAQQILLQRAQLLLSVNSQALEYSQQIALRAAETWNLLRERFLMHMELYRLQAQIYETEIKSAFAQLDAYRIELDGIRLQKDIERLDVDVWVQRINAQKTRTDVYIAQLQGIKIQADLELSKIQLFDSQVRAYLGQVQAKESEFKAYEAAISGDEAKVRAQSQVVDTYRATIDATRSVVDAEIAISESGISQNRNLVTLYDSEIKAFQSRLESEDKRFDNSVSAYRAALDGYRIELGNQISILNGELEISKQKLSATSTIFNGNLEAALRGSQLFQDRVRVQADTTISAANVSTSIASAALNAQNSIVSLVNQTTQEV